jgi:hypothetical protein
VEPLIEGAKPQQREVEAFGGSMMHLLPEVDRRDIRAPEAEVD